MSNIKSQPNENLENDNYDTPMQDSESPERPELIIFNPIQHRSKSGSSSISQPRYQGNGDNATIKFDPLDHVIFHKTITKVVEPAKQKRPIKEKRPYIQKRPNKGTQNNKSKLNFYEVFLQSEKRF